MKVLLSIKPEFAQKIFSGEKKFEFRRSIFKNTTVKKIVVYVSSPVQKVIGEFEIDCIVHEDIDKLWEITGKHAGISKDYFEQYFTDKHRGFAIKIKNAKKYKTPQCIKRDYKATAPQSFLYLKRA